MERALSRLEKAKIITEIIAILVAGIWILHSFVWQEMRAPLLLNIESNVSFKGTKTIDGIEFGIAELTLSASNLGAHDMRILALPAQIFGLTMKADNSEADIEFRAQSGEFASASRYTTQFSEMMEISHQIFFPQYVLSPGESVTGTRVIAIPIDQNFSQIAIFSESHTIPRCRRDWALFSACDEIYMDFEIKTGVCEGQPDYPRSFRLCYEYVKKAGNDREALISSETLIETAALVVFSNYGILDLPKYIED